jgi:hypothetical protein
MAIVLIEHLHHFSHEGHEEPHDAHEELGCQLRFWLDVYLICYQLPPLLSRGGERRQLAGATPMSISSISVVPKRAW